jgi:phosphinothricin acetyltransferase
MIRSANPKDSKEIAEIYNYYILNSIVTFEEEPISANEMSIRMKSDTSELPWLVYEIDQNIVGYAYAKHWKPRSAYRHSTEISIYLKHGEFNKGIGSRLYAELIRQLKSLNFHAIIGGIALPNDASIALHEKLGFKKVAHFKEVGFKFQKWIDVGYWQLDFKKG